MVGRDWRRGWRWKGHRATQPTKSTNQMGISQPPFDSNSFAMTTSSPSAEQKSEKWWNYSRLEVLLSIEYFTMHGVPSPLRKNIVRCYTNPTLEHRLHIGAKSRWNETTLLPSRNNPEIISAAFSNECPRLHGKHKMSHPREHLVWFLQNSKGPWWDRPLPTRKYENSHKTAGSNQDPNESQLMIKQAGPGPGPGREQT